MLTPLNLCICLSVSPLSISVCLLPPLSVSVSVRCVLAVCVCGSSVSLFLYPPPLSLALSLRACVCVIRSVSLSFTHTLSPLCHSLSLLSPFLSFSVSLVTFSASPLLTVSVCLTLFPPLDSLTLCQPPPLLSLEGGGRGRGWEVFFACFDTGKSRFHADSRCLQTSNIRLPHASSSYCHNWLHRNRCPKTVI